MSFLTFSLAAMRQARVAPRDQPITVESGSIALESSSESFRISVWESFELPCPGSSR